MKNKIMKIVLSVCTLLFIAGCKTTPKPVEADKLTAKLTENGYFIPKESNNEGIYGPVFIFLERHNSRLIQAQIAWGLEELRELGNINTIALEGMYIDEVLAADKLSYRTETEKQTVLLALLERGEIKAPELAYLAKDAFVFGIEKEEEYNFPDSDGSSNAFINYLVVSIYVDRGEAIKKIENEEAFNLLLSQNLWAQETYEMINGGRSIKEIIERLEELEKKIKPVSFIFSAQLNADFKQFKEFYKNANQRSLTMASSVYNVLQKKNEPLAMIVGLNHTKEIAKFFDEKGVRYYVLDPSGLYGGDSWSDLTYTAFINKRAGMPVFENAQIMQFFMNNLNTRPVIDEEWFKKENNFVLLIERMIAGKPEYASGGLRIEQNTLDRTNPADIKFKTVNEKGQEMYVRAVANPQGKKSGSYKKALEEMIERLSKIDEKNLPLTERIKAYEGVIEAFNVDDWTIFISPLMDVWNVNLNAL